MKEAISLDFDVEITRKVCVWGCEQGHVCARVDCVCVCERERERGGVTSKALVPLSIKSNLVSTPKVRSPGQSDEQE